MLNISSCLEHNFLVLGFSTLLLVSSLIRGRGGDLAPNSVRVNHQGGGRGGLHSGNTRFGYITR